MKFVCSVCGYVYEGDAAPAECPICHVGADKFIAQTEDRTWASEHVVGVAQGVSEDGFRRELEKGAKVNKLVEQACASVAEPTDAEIAAFFESRRDAYAKENRTLVDAHDEIRDLLRHDARGKAMDAFVAELKAAAKIEYKTVDSPNHEHGCSCGCGHHH